jgi:hypothetical protein
MVRRLQLYAIFVYVDSTDASQLIQNCPMGYVASVFLHEAGERHA